MYPDDLTPEEQTKARKMLENALALLSMVHTIRYGRDDTQHTVINISPRIGADPHDLIGGVLFPYTAIDTLCDAIFEQATRFRDENTALGFGKQTMADRTIADISRIIDAGNTPSEDLRTKARDAYAEAAARTEQPDLTDLNP